MAENLKDKKILGNDTAEEVLRKLNDSNLNSIFFLLLDYPVSPEQYLLLIKKNRSQKEEFLKVVLSRSAISLLLDLLCTIKRYDLLKLLGICHHNLKIHPSRISKLWKSLYEACDNFEMERDLKCFQKVFKEQISYEEPLEVSIVKAFNNKLVERKDLEALLDELNKSYQISKTWTARNDYYEVKSVIEEEQYCGLVVIVNHENFTGEVNGVKLRKREYSSMDVDLLKKMWLSFGFKVQTYIDYEAKDILQVFEKLSKQDFTHFDVFVTCYLSHGNQGIVYSSDSQRIKISDLIDFMANRCKSLIDKPKLFFIEACQGTRIQCGNPIPILSPPDNNSNSDEHPSTIPLFVDVFVAISSIPGYASFASKGKNSWFIEALEREMMQYGDKLSISEVMTKVNNDVYEKYGCINVQGQQVENCRQTMVHTNTLRKKLILKRKNSNL